MVKLSEDTPSYLLILHYKVVQNKPLIIQTGRSSDSVEELNFIQTKLIKIYDGVDFVSEQCL